MVHTLPVSISHAPATPARATAVESEESYQLVKRGEINPHEVEVVGAHAVEVTILWRSAILHVAHLDGTHDFRLTTRVARKAPAGGALMGGLAAGTGLITAGAMSGNYVVGAVGTALALAGAGAGIAFDHANAQRRRDGARFVVDAEMLAGADDAPVVLNGEGLTRFVFLPGARGEVEFEGKKTALDALVAAGEARPSARLAGAYEVEMRPGARYRMAVSGLTVLARVVAPGRRVAGAIARDPARLWAGVGAAGAVALLVGAALFATADDAAMLSPGNDEDRLAMLREFVQRQADRPPEAQPETRADDSPQGGTGTRAAGTEGQMGSRTASQRSARYAIRNNALLPQIARTSARDAVATRGIFAALGAPGGGMVGGQSGVVAAFGGMLESGMDDRNANGNMAGDAIGDAFGYGGLGVVGTGAGGGGDGLNTIGTGRLGTLGHGDGTGPGVGIGRGTGLGPRGSHGPIVRVVGRPVMEGALAPEAIRRVVLRNLGQIAHCHEQGLTQDPGLGGRVVVRFVIGSGGTVLAAGVSESSLAVPSVSECIASAVRRWQFPTPEGGGTVTVNYPFTLEPPAR